jgi:hypothetical protein
MKFASIVIIGLLGLATSACGSTPANSGNAGPGSFTGNLNNLGSSTPITPNTDPNTVVPSPTQ